MRLMASARKAWPIFASTILFQLAFPPFNLGLLVFVALVPWLLSLRESSGREAVRSGWLFGLLFWLVQFHWVQSLTFHWTQDAVLSYVPYLLGPLLAAWYFALFAYLAAKAWQRDAPWLIPIVWAGVEVFRSYVPILAFPWGLAASPLWAYPQLAQLAWFGTVYAVSAWVLMGNLLIARILKGDSPLRFRNHLFAFVALFVLSFVRLEAPLQGPVKRITIGQLGVDLAFGKPELKDLKVADAVVALYAGAILQKADLLVLPEGLIQAGKSIPPPVTFQVQPSPPVIFGGTRGDGVVYQSAFSYDGNWRFADKTRLVVFGEYVPFRNVLPFLDSFQLPGGDLTPGEKVTALQVGGIKVGPMLCFEGLFYDVAQSQASEGAQLLVQMCIDDWYMGTPAPDQLKQAAVWRAIETGLPVARSASLGYTLAVDQRGRVVVQAPLRINIPLHAELQIPERADRFAVVGYVPWAFALSLLWPLADPVLARLRHRKTKGNSPKSRQL